YSRQALLAAGPEKRYRSGCQVPSVAIQNLQFQLDSQGCFPGRAERKLISFRAGGHRLGSHLLCLVHDRSSQCEMRFQKKRNWFDWIVWKGYSAAPGRFCPNRSLRTLSLVGKCKRYASPERRNLRQRFLLTPLTNCSCQSAPAWKQSLKS